MNLEELAREIAEMILFSHVRDIEGLTVWEMTADHIKYNDDEALRVAFDAEDRYDALCNGVFEQIDKATVGISWDGGKTWVM